MMGVGSSCVAPKAAHRPVCGPRPGGPPERRQARGKKTK